MTREEALAQASFDPSVPKPVLFYDNPRWFPPSDEVLNYVQQFHTEDEDYRWDRRLDAVELREWPVLGEEPLVPEPVETPVEVERPDEPVDPDEDGGDYWDLGYDPGPPAPDPAPVAPDEEIPW